MAEPPGEGSPNFGADPSVHPIFGRQAYTPGLKTATSAISHAPQIYDAGKLAWNVGRGLLGKGSNDSPVGNLAGSDRGSPVWSGPPNEGAIDANSWDVPSTPSPGSGLATLAEDL
jgi:hypothetical protein